MNPRAPATNPADAGWWLGAIRTPAENENAPIVVEGRPRLEVGVIDTKPRRWTADDLWELPGREKEEMVDGCPTGPKAKERRLGFLRRSMVELRLVRRFATEPAADLGLFGPGFGFVAPSGRGLHPPDLVFIRNHRLPDAAAWEGLSPVAPDLAIEVLGLMDESERVAKEVADYLEGGVALLWVVDPEAQSVAVHTPGQAVRTLGMGDELDGGDVLPGFRVPVAELFR